MALVKEDPVQEKPVLKYNFIGLVKLTSENIMYSIVIFIWPVAFTTAQSNQKSLFDQNKHWFTASFSSYNIQNCRIHNPITIEDKQVKTFSYFIFLLPYRFLSQT